MDYEKKYKEALERAKQLYSEDCSAENKDTCEFIFPELRESEDERVIRIIKRQMCQGATTPTDEERAMVDAWLEKQKEQSMSATEVLARAGLKPYKDGNQWCILAGDNIQEGICGFGDTIDEALYEFLDEVLTMANSPQLKEQKPVEFSLKDKVFSVMKKLNSLNFMLKLGSKEEKLVNEITSEVRDLADYSIDKPVEWSDTNELVFQDICKHLSEEGYSGWIVLLNALRNGEFQPKQEWSEEDEKFFRTALWHIGYSISNGKQTVDCKCDTTEWFNGLRDRIKALPPRWKPSEEQMDALKDAAKLYKETHFEIFHPRIDSLINDLKTKL